jgi:hypothetical protein
MNTQASIRRANRISGALETTICGIPCLIEVKTCNVVKGSFSYNAASDHDYHGYTEIEFNVLDRKGYPARWLEGKMTNAEKADIEELILESQR